MMQCGRVFVYVLLSHRNIIKIEPGGPRYRPLSANLSIQPRPAPQKNFITLLGSQYSFYLMIYYLIPFLHGISEISKIRQSQE